MTARYSKVLLAGFAATLTACGGSSGSGVSAPTGGGGTPPPSAPNVTIERVYPALGFAQPVALLQAPGDASRWFVVEQGGIVRVFDSTPNTSTSDVYLDISAQVDSSASESGLLGMAFHPDFPMTPYVYVSYTRTGSGAGNPFDSYISRFTTPDNGATLDAGSEAVILTVDQDRPNHNGGNILFGPDGYLYLGLGDGGGGGDPDGHAQNTMDLLGSMVRIDVDGGSPYAIPAGNPFNANAPCGQGMAGGDNCPEIFAWGLRNPWRFSFDRSNGDLWLGDVGQGAWEEIDIVTVNSNYGWNIREGANCYNASSCSTSFVDPITEYDHGIGQSVTGGYVYRGTTITDLAGWYVFGDFVSGVLFGIPADSSPGVDPFNLGSTGLSIASFAEDQAGELYIVNYGGGIFQIVAQP